jgi:hypothetical protein
MDVRSARPKSVNEKEGSPTIHLPHLQLVKTDSHGLINK